MIPIELEGAIVFAICVIIHVATSRLPNPPIMTRGFIGFVLAFFALETIFAVVVHASIWVIVATWTFVIGFTLDLARTGRIK